MATKMALNSFQTKHPMTHHSFASYKAQNPIPPSSPAQVGGTRISSVSAGVLARRSALALNRSVNDGLSCLRPDFPSPSMFGIRNDPPDWTETVGIGIEQRANRVEIPLSIRIIKMKQRQLETESGLINEAAESTNCSSLRRAFSSFSLIVRELETHAVRTMMEGGVGTGESEDLIVGKVERDVNASLVWLFRQVFSRTPALMIDMMILLSNYIATAPSMASSQTITENGNTEDRGVIRKEPPPVFAFDDDEGSGLSAGEELLWRGMLEEVRKMRGKALGDDEAVPDFVVPVKVNDAEEHTEHLRTELLYQMNLSQDPDNPLLLCNYAQFLAHISGDYSRAEEYYKRATQLEQPDAEALVQYADFLHMVRRDESGAEERYEQAVAVEPNNPFYASKYANFLWSTGGEETCFPLDPSAGDAYSTTTLFPPDELL